MPTLVSSQTPGATTKDQLRLAKEKLEQFEAKIPKTDARIIGMWKSRVNRLEAQVVVEEDLSRKYRYEELSGEAARVNEKTHPSPSRSKKKGSMYCLCGCGKANNPGSRFQQGHDARLKAKFREVEIGTMKIEELPTVVKSILSDAGQLYFGICDQCGGPYLSGMGGGKSGKTGPVCIGKR